jgi:hypothetical protein
MPRGYYARNGNVVNGKKSAKKAATRRNRNTEITDDVALLNQPYDEITILRGTVTNIDNLNEEAKERHLKFLASRYSQYMK